MNQPDDQPNPTARADSPQRRVRNRWIVCGCCALSITLAMIDVVVLGARGEMAPVGAASIYLCLIGLLAQHAADKVPNAD